MYIIYIYQIFIIHSSLDGQQGCLQFFVIVNEATVSRLLPGKKHESDQASKSTCSFEAFSTGSNHQIQNIDISVKEITELCQKIIQEKKVTQGDVKIKVFLRVHKSHT